VLRLPGGRQSALTIGRSGGCDLVLGDSTVSRVHAVLRRFGDEWFLEDLGSTNGTRLNGFTIRAATAVRPGDRVGVGRLTFRVGGSGRP
jgi:pSer/pThr/pTyr-binding forkhead associated (FHA) protein